MHINWIVAGLFVILLVAAFSVFRKRFVKQLSGSDEEFKEQFVQGFTGSRFTILVMTEDNHRHPIEKTLADMIISYGLEAEILGAKFGIPLPMPTSSIVIRGECSSLHAERMNVSIVKTGCGFQKGYCSVSLQGSRKRAALEVLKFTYENSPNLRESAPSHHYSSG